MYKEESYFIFPHTILHLFKPRPPIYFRETGQIKKKSQILNIKRKNPSYQNKCSSIKFPHITLKYIDNSAKTNKTKITRNILPFFENFLNIDLQYSFNERKFCDNYLKKNFLIYLSKYFGFFKKFQWVNKLCKIYIYIKFQLTPINKIQSLPGIFWI